MERHARSGIKRGEPTMTRSGNPDGKSDGQRIGGFRLVNRLHFSALSVHQSLRESS